MRYQDVVLADGPVGYWPLDELSGTTAKDLGSTGVNGTYNGSPNLGAYRFPAGGRFPHFDGTDDYVTIADNNAWSPATAGVLCVEFWARTARVFGGSATRQCAVGKLASGNDEWQIVHQTQAAGSYSGSSQLPDGRTGVTDAWTIDSFGGGGVGQNSASGNGSVYVGPIQHVVARMDWNSTWISLWLNGVESSPPDTTIGTAPANGTATLRIGNRAYGDLHFQGGIAHVALYNKVLSANRIREHYRAGVTRPRRMAFRTRAA